jgi:peptidyl-prolyl cis-trans isomerase D
MIHIFRKYQQSLLIAMTILIIITFIWFWNGPAGRSGGLGGAVKKASIYGRTLYDTDIQRTENKFEVAEALGLSTLVQSLAGNAENQQEAVNNFIVNYYVFDHEADALQVFPTDAEVQDEELNRVPGLQTDGKFDPAKLAELVQARLPSLGFTDAVIDELVRDQVRVKKVTALIGATVALSPAELQNHFTEGNEKMDVSIIRLNSSDIEKSIVVSDDEAKKAYDGHKDQYKSDEQRKVSIASFELTGAQKDLKLKDRTDALQKLGNDAWSFAQAVVDKTANFAQQAKQYGAPVTSSAFFTAVEPDPTLDRVPALATNAFRLSSDYPSSDVLPGQNGYYVLHLDGTVPSQSLSFEQAKPKIVAQIQKDRAAQMMQTTANAVRTRMLAQLKAGKSFKDAAAATGVSVESIPPFSLQNASKLDVPDVQPIVESAISLADGQFSDFIPTDAGGLYVYMNGREPVDKSEASVGESMLAPQFLRQKVDGTFVEWMRLRKEAARLEIERSAS